MSTDQICDYCAHSAKTHVNGTGQCCAGAGSTMCTCPRFVVQHGSETEQVLEQVLAEDKARVGGSHVVTSILPPPMPDSVNHPSHYKQHPSGVECIQITEHMNFNLGNAVKYIWRAAYKDSELQDLEKARWYLSREIERLSK